MPTIKEQNAAFDAVNHKLPILVDHLVPNQNIPFVGNLHDLALQKIASPEARPVVLELVQAALVAAEKARA